MREKTQEEIYESLINKNIWICDFETTVEENTDLQESTEVWSSANVKLFTEDVHIFGSIDDTFKFFANQLDDCVLYYHNLKFDGAFWLDFLINKLKFKQGYQNDNGVISWKKEYKLKNKEFKYLISDRGQWYSIVIKVKNHYIRIFDSLKLLPFSVRKIGNDFDTKHKKLDMEYKGHRYANCPRTKEEDLYISNDVLVAKEALELFFLQGNTKQTIGGCCLSEFKRICKSGVSPLWQVKTMEYKELFPDLTNFAIPGEIYKDTNADEYIRRSYRGGWCYVKPGRTNQVIYNGRTADVNSLYPSVMHSKSGSKYPYGMPTFWKGNRIPKKALAKNKFYFIRIKTRFYLKSGFLPFIQIKNNPMYSSTESLTTSDIKYKGEYYKFFLDEKGNKHPAEVELTLTEVDYVLMKEHYNLVDCKIISGCYFDAVVGLFDEYIDKYAKIKKNSKGAKRQIAKLFLNNLYGKMATSVDSSFKIAESLDEIVKFYDQKEYNKKVGYIPIGSAITSYARNFTIRAAQKNYNHFIYADTDSIHCDTDDIKGIAIHPTEFCCWKIESTWDCGIFVRQKTYIEHVIEEDLEPIETPYYNIKCAGMPQRSKDIFIYGLNGNADMQQGKFDKDLKKFKPWSAEEKEFLFDENGKPKKYDLTDFKIGLCLPNKLIPKRVKGGIVLVDTTYKMR